MNVNIYAYHNSATHFANFLNLNLNYIGLGESLETPAGSLNYWISSFVHSNLNFNQLLPAGFFDNPNNCLIECLSHENVRLDEQNVLRQRIQYALENIGPDRTIIQVGTPQQYEYVRKSIPGLKHIMFFDFWELWTRSMIDQLGEIRPEAAHRKRFLFMNRRNYTQRLFLFYHLWSYEQFRTHSYTSFNPGEYWNERRSNLKEISDRNLFGCVKDIGDRIPNLRTWLETLELPQLPTRYSSNNPYNYSMSDRDIFLAHRETDINVITESNAYSIPQGFFPTEKLFRSIASGQPFIVYGHPGYYKSLRSLGYQTYETIFRETHDAIQDDWERGYRISRTVRKLSKISDSDFDKLMTRAKVIADFNLRRFRKRTDLVSIANRFTGPLAPLAKYLRPALY